MSESSHENCSILVDKPVPRVDLVAVRVAQVGAVALAHRACLPAQWVSVGRAAVVNVANMSGFFWMSATDVKC